MERVEVDKYTKLMNKYMNIKLDYNAHKGHWNGLDDKYMRKRLHDEVDEFMDAVGKDKIPESADVNNFLMFVMDNNGLLECDGEKTVRPNSTKLSDVLDNILIEADDIEDLIARQAIIDVVNKINKAMETPNAVKSE